jgi:hypothetical protein
LGDLLYHRLRGARECRLACTQGRRGFAWAHFASILPAHPSISTGTLPCSALAPWAPLPRAARQREGSPALPAPPRSCGTASLARPRMCSSRTLRLFANSNITADEALVRVETEALPAVGPNQVRVQMLAAPINPADLNIVEGAALLCCRSETLPGTYGLKHKLPAVAGLEGVGQVKEVGGQVKGLAAGDLVIAASSPS